MRLRTGAIVLMVSSAATPALGANAADLRAAIARSLPLMQTSAEISRKNAGCDTCHHQGLGLLAVAAARARGLRVDETQLATQIAPQLGEGAGRGGGFTLNNVDYLGPTFGLVDSGALGVAASDRITMLVHRLAGAQHVDGHWTPYPKRLPLEGSHFSQTALTIRALQLYTPPARQPDVAVRIARAVAWLSTAAPVDTEDAAMQLLGLRWGGASDEQVRRSAAGLLARRNADGGWAQTPARASDAYATGQALVALTQGARILPSSALIQNGLGFLLRTQLADGTWLVRTRRTWKTGNGFYDSGFPHGPNQFISYAGTAWAVTALAAALDSSPLSGFTGCGAHDAALSFCLSSTPAAMSPRLTPLMRAVVYGEGASVRALLDSGRDPNERNADGETALMYAVYDEQLVEMLLRAGARVDIASTSGHTPLLMAADYAGAGKSFDLLAAHGADLLARSSRPTRLNTAVTRAALRGDVPLVGRLLSAGAAVNEPNGVSRLLQVAVEHEDLPLVQMLLGAGAAIESRPAPGSAERDDASTPLMWASDRGVLEIAAALVRKGADVNARDSRGWTPLMYAAGAVDAGSADMVALLLSAGADRTIRNHSGDSASDIARAFRRDDLLALLEAEEQ